MNIKIINKLKELKPILKEKYGIEEFGVFGSVARGEDREDSDVDIAVTKFVLKDGFAFIKAGYFLEKELDKKIDIGSFNSMKTFVKNRIQREMVYV